MSAHWNADIQAALAETDVSVLKMRALAVLTVASPVTVNDLAKYTITEQSTMSRAVDGLVRSGLVSRHARSDDLRSRDLAITERGNKFFQKVWPIMFRNQERMLAGIEPKERRILVSILHRMITNLEEGCKVTAQP